MKYTQKMKVDGELAASRLSEKAAEYYNGTDPLTVFAYENEDGETRYSYSYSTNPYADRYKEENLTFEELQEAFEEIQKGFDKQLEADGEPEGKLDWHIIHDLDDDNGQPMEWSAKLHSGEFLWIDKETDGYALYDTHDTNASPISVSETLKGAMESGEEYNAELYAAKGIGMELRQNNKLPEPEKQSESKKLTALLTVIQGGMTKYLDMGNVSMDDIFRQLKKTALPFIEIKGDVIHDEGRFAELEQSGKVLVSVTADIDNDSLTVYEINGVLEEKRTDENTRIWSREKMSNFLKDRVREPKTDNSQHSPFCGGGRSHVSEHEREM